MVSISLKYDKFYNLKCLIVIKDETIYNYTQECRDKYFFEKLLNDNSVYVFDIKYFLKYLIKNNIKYDISKIEDLKLITNLLEEKHNINITDYSQSKYYIEVLSKINAFKKIYREDFITYIPQYILTNYCSVEAKIISQNIIVYDNEYYKNYKKYLTGLAECELNGIKIIDKSIENINHFVYPIYTYDSSRTGRLGNTVPINLLNIPKDHETRKKFISRFENGCFLHADWNAIDLRVAFAISKQHINTEDLHKEIARLIFEKEEITQEERESVKEVNFGILYGASYDTVAKKLNYKEEEIKEIYKKIFLKFGNLLKSIKESKEIVKNTGCINSYFGRKRSLNENDFTKIYNSRIQMTSADICIRAVYFLNEKLRNYKSKIVPYIVFDNLVIDVHPDEKDKIEEIIKEVMSSDAPGDLKEFINFPVKIEYKNTL